MTIQAETKQQPMAVTHARPSQDVALPPTHQPTLSPVNGSEGAIKAYVLSDNVTGVVSGYCRENNVTHN
jgi:hypothetical protein